MANFGISSFVRSRQESEMEETPRQTSIITELRRQERSRRGEGRKTGSDAGVGCGHLNAEQATIKCRQASSPRPYPFGRIVVGLCTELRFKLSIILDGRTAGEAGYRVEVAAQGLGLTFAATSKPSCTSAVNSKLALEFRSHVNALAGPVGHRSSTPCVNHTAPWTVKSRTRREEDHQSMRVRRSTLR